MVFCTSSTEIKKIISPVIEKSKDEESDDQTETDRAEKLSLEKLIQEKAKQYCTEEEVENILEKIKEQISKIHFSSDIEPLFDLELKFQSHDSYNELPKQSVIGNWIDKNGESYFAEPETKEIPYETEVPDYSTYGIMRGGYKTITKYRSQISGFKTTVTLSYDLIEIDAEPKYPNIPPFNCTIVLLISKRTIIFFYFFSYYREKNWKERKLRHDFKWQFSEGNLKNQSQVLETITKILKDFEMFVSQNLCDRFKKNLKNKELG